MKGTEVASCLWSNLKIFIDRKRTKGKLVFRLSFSKAQSLFLISCHARENKQKIIFCGKFCIGGWTPSQLITPLEIFSCLSFVPKVSISQAKLPMHYFWQKHISSLTSDSFLRPCSPRNIFHFWTQNTLPICSKQIFICHKVGLESTKRVLLEKISGETQLTTD